MASVAFETPSKPAAQQDTSAFLVTPTPSKKMPSDASFLSPGSGSPTSLPPVEATLATMERTLISAKLIPFTTVSEVFSVFWSDKDNTAASSASFYEKWLASRDNTQIKVGYWQKAASEDEQDDEAASIRYKEEKYDMKRVVTFLSPRTLSSITSPEKDPTKVLVAVEETQYCRMEEDQCIIMTEVRQSNIPFGEAFSVQWRWVATNVKPKKVCVRVGFSVDFYLDVLVADQLRQQQGDFSYQRHLHLYRAMKQEIADRQLPLALRDPWHGVVTVLRLFFPFFAPERTITTVPRMVAKVLEQLRLIELMPVPAETTDVIKDDFKQLKTARDALKALYEKEKEWVISTLPEEETESSDFIQSKSPPEELPPFLVPIAKAVGNLHVIDPWDNKSMKHVLSETDNTVILLPYTDATLDKMKLLSSKTIFHCTIEDVKTLMTLSDTAWYESWLADSGRSEIDVGHWAEESVKDDFSGEVFSHHRAVTCRFDKSIYNKSADPSSAAVLAFQKQAQYCRFDEDNSAFIWSMTTTVEGMAFADCFRTHIRWVISQVEEDAVQVKVGYSCDILKPILVESQLREDALSEAQERQFDLLRSFRSALMDDIEARHRKHPVVEAVESSVTGAVDHVRRWIRLYPDQMLRDDPDWEPVFKDFRKKLKLLEQTLRHTGTKVEREVVQEEARHIFLELEQIRSSLEGIVATLGNAGKVAHTLDKACFTPEKEPPL